jgi:hypothetical protein
MTEVYTRFRHQCISQWFSCITLAGLDCQAFFDKTNTNVFKRVGG